MQINGTLAFMCQVATFFMLGHLKETFSILMEFEMYKIMDETFMKIYIWLILYRICECK